MTTATTESAGARTQNLLSNIRHEMYGNGKLAAFGEAVNGNRYHVWLNPETLKIDDDKIYINPPLTIDHNDPAYFTTIIRKASAKVYVPMIRQLTTGVNVEKARAEKAEKDAIAIATGKVYVNEEAREEALKNSAGDMLAFLKRVHGKGEITSSMWDELGALIKAADVPPLKINPAVMFQTQFRNARGEWKEVVQKNAFDSLWIKVRHDNEVNPMLTANGAPAFRLLPIHWETKQPVGWDKVFVTPAEYTKLEKELRG